MSVLKGENNMYIENNPLRFVRIDDFRDEDVEEMKKPFILVESFSFHKR